VDAPFLLRALSERSPEALLASAAPISELTCVCVFWFPCILPLSHFRVRLTHACAPSRARSCCRLVGDRNLLRIAHALETLTARTHTRSIIRSFHLHTHFALTHSSHFCALALSHARPSRAPRHRAQLVFHALSRQRFASRGLGLLSVSVGGAAHASAFFGRLLPACAGLAERCVHLPLLTWHQTCVRLR
jgi:hypothetical protein